VKNVINTTVEKFGRLDCLFNNAGYQGAFKPVHEYPDEDFPRVMNINVTGVFYMLKYATIQMKS
jgi:NAD(P)-dependent dehydrogenase (short-subunit alcohol dehydrogenase family)